MGLTAEGSQRSEETPPSTDFRRFAWKSPPLDRKQTSFRIAGEFLPALDERGMQRAAPKQRMCRIRTKFLIKLLHLRENLAHLDNGIHAKVRARAMSRFADRFHLEPDKAPVGKDELKFRELGNDRAVRVEALCKIHRADTGILLVDHAREDHIAAQILFLRFRNGKHTGRETAFHIIGAASIQTTAVDARLMPIGHACHTDRIHVTVEQQGFPAARATRNPHHIRSPRNGFYEVLLPGPQASANPQYSGRSPLLPASQAQGPG